MVAMACACFTLSAHAQYKGPRDYFPKNNPAPPAGGGKPSAPNAPKAPDKQPPAVAQQPKFKDLPLNTQFYFLADTNHAYPWTKITASTAKNTKNGLTQSVSAEMLIQK